MRLLVCILRGHNFVTAGASGLYQCTRCLRESRYPH